MRYSAILNDDNYKKFKDTWGRIENTLKDEEAVEECKTLHNARLSTKIRDNKGQFSVQQLYDANAIDLSTRSRMVYLAANLKLRLSKLETAFDAIQNYIINRYTEDLRTIDAKNKFAKRVLNSYIKRINTANAALEFIEALIKDIDQSGYSMRNIVDCVKLLSETKGKII